MLTYSSTNRASACSCVIISLLDPSAAPPRVAAESNRLCRVCSCFHNQFSLAFASRCHSLYFTTHPKWCSKQDTEMKTSFGPFSIVNRIFSVCAPQYVLRPQLQGTCHYIVNHYVKIWHVLLGDANNMRPLSWGGGGGAQTVKIQ